MRRFAILCLYTFITPALPDACTGITSAWFDDLVYCGITATGSLGAEEMENCFWEINQGSSYPPYPPNELHNSFASLTYTSCGACAMTFSNDVYQLRSSFATNCGFLGTPITWDANSSAYLRTSSCLDLMWSAVSTMNNCMTQSGGTDIVTGTTNCRCAVFGDFNTNFDAVYSPWDQLVVQAVAHSSSSFNAGALAPGAATALGSISRCNTCFNNLYSTLFSLKSGLLLGEIVSDPTTFTTNCKIPYLSDCTGNSYVAEALADFISCTGGDHIDTAAPTDCSDIPNGSWYTQLVASGLVAGTSYEASSLSIYIKNINAQGATLLTGHLDATDSCAIALLDFANAVFALKTNIGADCDSATSSACLVWLYDAINSVNNDRTMGGLDLVTGLTSTRCTNTEWTKLTYKYRSMVPMYIAAKYANSFAGAITAMPNNADVTNLEDSINGIGCAPAFAAFVSDAHTLYTSITALETACADPYTTGCAAALVTQLNDFTTSSGQVLNWSATSTACTAAEFEALVDANVPDSVLAATTSPSVVSFVTVLNEIYFTIGTNNLNAPCWLCYTELARAVYNLGRTDLATCVAGITGAACYAIIGEYINGFQDCSGFAFVLAPVTTAVPATSETTTSSTATTTADPTITTVVSTTSATTILSTTILSTTYTSTKIVATMEAASTGLAALFLVAVL